MVRDSHYHRPGSSQGNSFGACDAQNVTGIDLLRRSLVFCLNVIQQCSILILFFKTCSQEENYFENESFYNKAGLF